MRLFLLSVFTLFLAACVAPSERGPHNAPPPDFPPMQTPLPGGQSCGGFTAGPQPSCAPTEYCHYELRDQCGAADAPGTCRPKPEMCTMDYNPVCGCDGQTYPNECAANGNGVSAAYKGQCE